MMKKAAHFLLISSLQKSPPNDALTKAYAEIDVSVDFYAPGHETINGTEDNSIRPVQYGLKWCAKNLLSRRWRAYDYFSCTSEDPIVIAGLLSFIYRKPLIFLSDEIKSGSYRGDRAEYWKKLCRWAMRRAAITIVNDESRVSLQRSYASLRAEQSVTVYPGCFLNPPEAKSTHEKSKPLVLAYSGGFNLSGGVAWAMQALNDCQQLTLLVQPLGIDQMTRILLQQHRYHDRITLTDKVLNWQEAWQSMGDVDIGVAIYHNDSPQFQNMGISSNRLCMFIAMGVPVIVSRQASFQFVEDYECGFMVENQAEFNQAVNSIGENLEQMKKNALRCAAEYINTADRHKQLTSLMKGLG